MILKFLIVEPGKKIDEVSFETLGYSGHFKHAPRIFLAKNLAQARVALRDNRFDAVLLDISLHEFSPLDWLPRLVSEFPETPVIVYASKYNREQAIRAIELGAEDYVLKDFTDQAGLCQRILRAIERHKRRAMLMNAGARFLAAAAMA